MTVGLRLVVAAVLAPRRLRAWAAPIGVAAAAAAAVFAPLAAHFVRHPADFGSARTRSSASRTLSGADLWRAYASNAWRSAQGVVLQGKGDPRWHYNLPGRPMLGESGDRGAVRARGLLAPAPAARHPPCVAPALAGGHGHAGHPDDGAPAGRPARVRHHAGAAGGRPRRPRPPARGDVGGSA
ncbi:MAG: hypothetical protein U0470_06180 [Anaerolineae bacterium]